jgi:hypothetical protein
MDTVTTEVIINGVAYIPKLSQAANALDGMKYCIIRAEKSGVFAGYLESRNGKEVVLRQARRIWYWSGAASLSQLAMEGVKNPDKCRFPCEVDRIEILDVIEIIDCTEAARKNIQEVPIWKV